MASILELARTSSLIFTGTVVERGASSVPDLPARGDLAVIRVERGLRVNPVLGDLAGKLVTVAAQAPEALRPGQRAVFFTNSWIHGRGIAAREVDRVDAGQEDVVADAVARLPELHLQDRLRDAQAVVSGRVERVREVPLTTYDRNAALWAAADLQVESVLSGQVDDRTVVCFPTSDRPQWARSPRLRARQRGIFVLHAPRPRSEAELPSGSLVVLDTADVQALSQRELVERLLAGIGSEGGGR